MPKIKMNGSTVVHIDKQRRPLEAGKVYDVPGYIADDLCKDRSGKDETILRRNLADLRGRRQTVELEIERIEAKRVTAYSTVDEVITVTAERASLGGLRYLHKKIENEIADISSQLERGDIGPTAELVK